MANTVEEDGVGSRDGDLDEFSTLRIFKPEAARGLEGNVRWPGPVMELGVPGGNRYGKRRLNQREIGSQTTRSAWDAFGSRRNTSVDRQAR